MVLVIIDHIFCLLMEFNKSWAGPEMLEPFNGIYKVALFYWTMPARKIVRPICLVSFCFLSGISCAFSKSNKKRAYEMLGVWLLVLVVSNILEYIRSSFGLFVGVRTMRVDFNIIGVLAWSIFAYSLVEKKSWKTLLVIAIIGICLHPVCYLLQETDFAQKVYLIPFWKPASAVADQADYLPLFPYLGFFFLGALLSRFTYAKNKKSFFKRFEFERPFCFIGRHSLVIYGAHFLILIGIFSLVGVFISL